MRAEEVRNLPRNELGPWARKGGTCVKRLPSETHPVEQPHFFHCRKHMAQERAFHPSPPRHKDRDLGLCVRCNGVELGTLTLVVNGSVVVGTVRTLGAVYTIRTAGDGTYVIRQIDESSLPPLGEPFEPTLSPRDATAETDDLPPDDGSVYDHERRTGGLWQAVTVRNIPRGPGALDDRVTMEVYLPPTARAAGLAELARLGDEVGAGLSSATQPARPLVGRGNDVQAHGRGRAVGHDADAYPGKPTQPDTSRNRPAGAPLRPPVIDGIKEHDPTGRIEELDFLESGPHDREPLLPPVAVTPV